MSLAGRHTQLDLEDMIGGCLAEFRQYELATAVEDAVNAIRARRESFGSNMTEKQEIREMLSEIAKPYGFYIASLPTRKGVGYGS